MGCIWAKEECGWSEGCASYVRPCLECLCWLSLRRNSCWLIDSGCAYTSVVGSKRHMGPEKRGCLWASWERPDAPQGVLVKSVTLYRLALAGDASFGRCRCTGNKISLTRKAALFTWPTEVSEEWRCQDLQMHFIAWSCSESQYWGTSWPDGFLQSHCFSPSPLWLSQSLHMWCSRDLRFPLGIHFFYFCLIHSFKGHGAKLWEFSSSSWYFFVSQDLIIIS